MKIPHKRYLITVTSLSAIMLSPVVAFSAEAVEGPVRVETETEPVSHKPIEPVAADKKSPFEIRTGNAAIKFGGFVKLDAMHDFDPIGNEDQFKVNSIPVSGDPDSESGDSNHWSVKQTRLSFDYKVLEGEASGIHAYFEGDFFGSDSDFRIRHAYGEWKGVLAGQTWSTFQDISARPVTLDYEGTDAEIFVRQPQVRYTRRVSDAMQWSIAAEESDSQIDALGGMSGSGQNDLPDITGNLRFSNADGHVQLGGIWRQLGYASDDGTVDESSNGYGLNLSGSKKVFGKDTVMGQFAFGSGISRYIESFGGTSSDAVLTTAGDLDVVDASAVVLGYHHSWSSDWSTTLSGAFAELDNVDGQQGSAIKSATSAHLNLVYKPIPQFLVGGELMWGERENYSGDFGDATRFQISVAYHFR